ncbi:MAG: PulJ/GspJ family protein [Planctomycetales bacterium]
MSATTSDETAAITRDELRSRGELSADRPGFVRRGFTLVEMLVAVTLVLMIMLLFAEIFGLASDSMTLQMAISDNDQQVRMLSTVLRADMNQRTFRSLVPFFPNEESADFSNDTVLNFNNRRGYFYLSLNAQADGTDNVLQFTVETSSDTPFYGKATTLPPVPSPGNVTAFWDNTNQPDWDDGQGRPNGSAFSQVAEVSYFMRGGSLYRRVLLLRQPTSISSPESVQPTQSVPNAGADYFDPVNGIYGGEFWSDFDYSARNDAIVAGLVVTAPLGGARFIGLDKLNNQDPPDSYPLGISRMRFGFDRRSGLPREYSDGSGSGFFIGRFIQEETSHPDFNYPQGLSLINGSNENPFDSSVVLTDNLNTDLQTVPDGVLDEFANGPRAGEDLLLSNVHEFRVEVWDDRLSDFAPIAHSRSDSGPDGIAGNGDDVPGDFNFSRRLNNSYFPPGGGASVFDTWHPLYDLDDADGSDLDNPYVVPAGTTVISTLEPPPFRPMTFDPTGVSAPLPQNTNTGTPTGPEWQPNTPYQVGDVVFPQVLNDANYDGIHDTIPAAVPTSPNNPVEGSQGFGYLGRAFYYRCEKAGTSGPATAEPAWSAAGNKNDDVIIGDLDPADLLPAWEAVHNLRPIRSIRFTIRFLHPRSGKMRQLSLVHSLDGSG